MGDSRQDTLGYVTITNILRNLCDLRQKRVDFSLTPQHTGVSVVFLDGSFPDGDSGTQYLEPVFS